MQVHKIGPWSSFSPPNVGRGDSSPLSEPCGDESPHSTNSPIGLNDDQGPKLQVLPQNNRQSLENSRSYFKVIDAPQYGKIVSLNSQNVKLYLGKRAPAHLPIHVVVTYGKYVKEWVSEARRGEKIDQQMATLNVGNITAQVTMNSVWGKEFFPIPVGKYNILIPNYPHSQLYTR